MTRIFLFSALGSTPAWSRIWRVSKKRMENMPYKYNEPHQGGAQPCHELHIWMSVYPGKRQRQHRVLKLSLHVHELGWHDQQPEID